MHQCPECKAMHRQAKGVDTKARASKAAGSRWKARLEAHVEERKAQGKPTDICPHGREFKHCTLMICKAMADG